MLRKVCFVAVFALPALPNAASSSAAAASSLPKAVSSNAVASSLSNAGPLSAAA